MIFWLMRRILQALFVMVAMTTIVFVAINVVGDPVSTLISPDADQAEKARIIAQFGYDKPVLSQYLIFIQQIATGHFADSYVYGSSAISVILARLPATVELVVSGLLIAITLGIPLGLYAGLRPDSPVSKTIMAFSILGFSVPSFWFAIIMIMLFSVDLGWLPSGGRGETGSLFGVQWAFMTRDGLAHLLLPAITISLVRTSLIVRLVRAGVREIIPQDYVRFARAKGLHERRIVGVHVLKNIMIPIVTVIGVEFGSLIAFSVVTENIFAWPGMGKLIIDSINSLDRPVIVAYLMLIVVIFVTVNLLIDIIYTLLDPRVRISAMGRL